MSSQTTKKLIKKNSRRGESTILRLSKDHELVVEDASVSSPKKPPHLTFEEWQRIQMERVVLATNSSPVDHSRLLIDEQATDVIFNVSGKTIRAHRVILEVRCPNLFVIAVKKKTIKKVSITIEIDEKFHITYSTLQTFIKFLYSANIQFFGKEISEIVQLVHIAKLYECRILVQITQRYLAAALKSSNWFHALKESQRLGLVEVKTTCKMWAKDHFTELVVQKAGVDALGLDLFHEVVLYVHIPQEEEDIPSIQTLTQNGIQAIKDDFKRIYEEMYHADGGFRFGDELALCHTSILLGQSGELIKLFKKGNNGSEISEKYELDIVTFKILLKFLYYHAVDEINPYIARQLRPFAMDFGLVKLRDVCDYQIQNGFNRDTVIDLLKLVRNVNTNYKSSRKHKEIAAEIETTCLSFISTNFTIVNLSTLTDTNTICDVITTLQLQIRQDRRWKYVNNTSKRKKHKSTYRNNRKHAFLKKKPTRRTQSTQNFREIIKNNNGINSKSHNSRPERQSLRNDIDYDKGDDALSDDESYMVTVAVSAGRKQQQNSGMNTKSGDILKSTGSRDLILKAILNQLDALQALGEKINSRKTLVSGTSSFENSQNSDKLSFTEDTTIGEGKELNFFPKNDDISSLRSPSAPSNLSHSEDRFIEFHPHWPPIKSERNYRMLIPRKAEFGKDKNRYEVTKLKMSMVSDDSLDTSEVLKRSSSEDNINTPKKIPKKEMSKNKRSGRRSIQHALRGGIIKKDDINL